MPGSSWTRSTLLLLLIAGFHGIRDEPDGTEGLLEAKAKAKAVVHRIVVMRHGRKTTEPKDKDTNKTIYESAGKNWEWPLDEGEGLDELLRMSKTFWDDVVFGHASISAYVSPFLRTRQTLFTMLEQKPWPSPEDMKEALFASGSAEAHPALGEALVKDKTSKTDYEVLQSSADSGITHWRFKGQHWIPPRSGNLLFQFDLKEETKETRKSYANTVERVLQFAEHLCKEVAEAVSPTITLVVTHGAVAGQLRNLLQGAYFGRPIDYDPSQAYYESAALVPEAAMTVFESTDEDDARWEMKATYIPPKPTRIEGDSTTVRWSDMTPVAPQQGQGGTTSHGTQSMEGKHKTK